MAVKHRAFNADRFIDKFRGREGLLLSFIRQWEERLDLGPLQDEPEIKVIKDWLAIRQGSAWDEMIEVLYQVYDLCTEQGHEYLVQVCREAGDYDPDPEAELPVEWPNRSEPPDRQAGALPGPDERSDRLARRSRHRPRPQGRQTSLPLASPHAPRHRLRFRGEPP